MCVIQKWTRRWFAAPSIAAAVLVAPTAARAEGWRFEVQPYAYVPLKVKGTATIGAHEVPIDLGLADLTDSRAAGNERATSALLDANSPALRFAAAARVEGWKDRWGFAVDLTYLSVGDDGSLAGVPFDIQPRLFVGDLIGQYRLNPWRLVDSTRKSFAIDFGLGARVNRLDLGLELGERELDAGRTRLQALGAARGVVRLSPHWALVARSALALPQTFWAVGGAIEWNVPVIALKLGYRYASTSLGDRLALDIRDHGPYLGVGIGFGEGPIY